MARLSRRPARSCLNGARGHFEADTRVFGGRVTHRLCRAPTGHLLIAEKRIDLVNAEGSFNAMLAPL